MDLLSNTSSMTMDISQLSAKKMPNVDNVKGKTDEQIRKTAEDFEAVFLTQMVEQMFSSLSTDGPFGGGHGEKVFRSMMAQEYGKVMAANGGVGIADDVQREMLKLQEARS
ncbi:MAG: rod-binding protein [Alphaproteobacteria bacterium]|nr:rod-binding protein [Alphaproteobacteria bacterium]